MYEYKGYFGSVSQNTTKFFSCVTLRSSTRTHPRPLIRSRIITKNTKNHPTPKHGVIIERPFNGFSINLQAKKLENKMLLTSYTQCQK